MPINWYNQSVKISDAGGENAIIEIARKASCGLPVERLGLGIGDDAAILRFGEDDIVVTCDLLVENVHFRTDWASAYEIGWKSAVANISDVAAMGAVPRHALVSLGLPDADLDFVRDLYEGLGSACKRWNSAVVGGDTVRSEVLVVNITWIGDLAGASAVLRSGARPGDLLMVTNCLGNSLAGLRLLQNHGRDGAIEVSAALVNSHLRPTPRVEAARAMTATGAVHAMMDLSDGLAADLPKLCRASGVGARINSQDLPISSELVTVCRTLGWNQTEVACVGGEDYELLAAVDRERLNEVSEAARVAGSDVTVIGEVLEGDRVILVGSGGAESRLPDSWEHF